MRHTRLLRGSAARRSAAKIGVQGTRELVAALPDLTHLKEFRLRSHLPTLWLGYDQFPLLRLGVPSPQPGLQVSEVVTRRSWWPSGAAAAPATTEGRVASLLRRVTGPPLSDPCGADPHRQRQQTRRQGRHRAGGEPAGPGAPPHPRPQARNTARDAGLLAGFVSPATGTGKRALRP